MRAGFDHVTTWIFDLDETLYPPTTPLFPQIEARMTAWIAADLALSPEDADRLRDRLWSRHGTTLAGLMREHGIDPHPFLRDVHDVDFSVLAPDADLRAALAALPGRRIVFTNGTVPYALRVLEARGLAGLWDAVYGVEEAGMHPKPDRTAYEAVFARDGLDPRRATMFEDSARNLAVPKAMGAGTVHVAPEPVEAPFIDHHTDDLTAFLCAISRG